MKSQHFGPLALIALLIILAGCGSSNSAAPPSSAGASVITIGDAAADNIVAFEITINSLVLSNSISSVTAVPSPHRLEMTHLSATVEDLSLSNIPNGTYTHATISWSSPEVSFLDGAGVLHELQSAASGTTDVPLNLVVGGANVLNFDIDVAASVTVNTVAGTASFNAPVFTLTAMRQLAETEREAETGEQEHIVGSVVSASSTSLTISVGGADTRMTFVINAGTQLESGMTSTSQLVVNQIVVVEGTTQADGTKIAREVEAESADGNGTEAEGLVTNVAGSTFTMIAHDASGASTSTADFGKSITVDAARANFSIAKSKINTGNFVFSGLANLHNGQRVEVDSDTAKSAGAGTVSDDGTIGGAKKIKLLQQALTGTVSGSGPNTFTLAVPADSAFAKLAGVTSVQVVNNGAQLKNGAVISDGATLRVRGLLFFDTTGGHLAAGRITTP